MLIYIFLNLINISTYVYIFNLLVNISVIIVGYCPTYFYSASLKPVERFKAFSIAFVLHVVLRSRSCINLCLND
jgi:hypothetical protein